MVTTERGDLRVELCGMQLKTPLLPASGTHSKEAILEARDVYGAILPKTVTLNARAGNPPPRVADTRAGMVNSIGLQNPGLEQFLRELEAYDGGDPIFVSVAGDTVDEFYRLCERLSVEERVKGVELNLSCPNVECGGLAFCSTPLAVEEVVKAARRACPGKPVLAKLTNEGVVANAIAAERAGADAVTLINTIPALTVDAYTRAVLVRGGLSGPAIKPIALRAVYDVYRAVSIPVVGCGGVLTGLDVAEFMLAGASAVQIGTVTFLREPWQVLDEFAGYLKEMGLDARSLTGQVHSDIL